MRASARILARRLESRVREVREAPSGRAPGVLRAVPNARRRPLHFSDHVAPWPVTARRSPNAGRHGIVRSPVYPCFELDLDLVFRTGERVVTQDKHLVVSTGDAHPPGAGDTSDRGARAERSLSARICCFRPESWGALGPRPNIGETADSPNGGHGLSEELSVGWHADWRLSRAVRARVTFLRMSGALAVQTKDLGVGGWLCALL